jgi:subtilisin family serine protease
MGTPRNSTVVHKTALGIGEVDVAPKEVLAVGLDRAAIARIEALGFKTQHVVKPDNSASVVQLSLPPDVDAAHARDLLNQQFPGNRFAPNKIYRIFRSAMRDDLEPPKPGQPVSGGSCDPERCFSRNLIQWRDELGTCARGLKVGIIDTQIDFTHSAFNGINVQSADFTRSGRTAAPNWHGTGVLALLAGSSGSNTPGLIPAAEFYTASTFYAEEGGGMATDTISLLKALQWMKEKEVKLINMSFAGPKDTLIMDGTVFVAAAGNEGPLADPAYPAAYPQVIAVTAVTKDRHNYRYANRGQHIDFAEPGVDIWTAVPGGREGFHSGTSFAAPHATAIISVTLRSLSPQTIAAGKAGILAKFSYIDLGTPGPDEIYGRGLLVAPASCTPPSNVMASASR